MVCCGNARQFFETRTIYISWTVRHFTFTWAIKNLFLRVNTEAIPSDSLVKSGHLFTFIMAQSLRSNIWTGYISTLCCLQETKCPGGFDERSGNIGI